MKAAPGLGLARPRIYSVVWWLGPGVALRDASISAGLIWFVVQIGALRAGAETFGLTMTAIAMIAAWQSVGVTCSGPAPRLLGPRSSAAEVSAEEAAPARPVLPASYRAPAAVLAGAIGCAGVLDTRLAGAVIGASIAVSVLVSSALQPPHSHTSSAPKARQAPVSRVGVRRIAAPRFEIPAAAGIVRGYLLIRAWMQVGVTAACLAAIAKYSLGAALVLVCAASAYDAGSHLSAAGQPPGLRGPLAGGVAAATVILALTGLSVPPFVPSDVVRFGAIAVLTLPLGPATARSNTALAARKTSRLAHGSTQSGSTQSRSNQHGSNESGPKRTAQADDRDVASSDVGGSQGAWQRARREWAVRRLDSLSVTALVWMWGLGLVSV